MEKPVLVVMAAGMGSRYGGLKQIDPVGANGQLIIDYSIYDARRAGFETVVFVIKRELAEQFRAAIGDRLSRVIEVKYAYQELEDLPAGYGVPEGRVKPWGPATRCWLPGRRWTAPSQLSTRTTTTGRRRSGRYTAIWRSTRTSRGAMNLLWWVICWAIR